jgi:hypothetical protein
MPRGVRVSERFHEKELCERLLDCVSALDVAWGDIQDWLKTARGLRERSKHPKGPDYDNVPHLRGIEESERALARIAAAATAAQKVLDRLGVADQQRKERV